MRDLEVDIQFSSAQRRIGQSWGGEVGGLIEEVPLGLTLKHEWVLPREEGDEGQDSGGRGGFVGEGPEAGNDMKYLRKCASL